VPNRWITGPNRCSSNEQEVAYFADEHRGVLVDTVHLFRHWIAVQRGEQSAEDVRSRLVALHGMFTDGSAGRDGDQLERSDTQVGGLRLARGGMTRTSLRTR